MLSLATALLVTLAPAPWSEGGPSQGEDLVIELVTFGPGDTLTEWWGHTALVVHDTRLHQDRLYNYGMFGFSTGFVHKFVQGRLEFWVEDTPYLQGMYRLYETLNRSIHIQELNLLPEQRLVLARALAKNVLPENREYLYQHYRDNCSTRPRDLIDLAVGGQLLEWSKTPGRMSIREHTRRYSQVNPAMSLVLDYLQNDELEIPVTLKDEAFLPDELELQLDKFQVKREDGTLAPLVARKTVLFEAKREPTPARGPNWNLWLFLLGSGVGALGLFLWSWGRKGGRLPRILLGLITALIGLGQGALGLFLFLVGLFTDHSVAHRNENLFLVNPITLAALPLGLMLIFGSTRARKGLLWTWGSLAVIGVVGVLCKVLPAFDQNNWNLNALELPMTFAFAALWWLDARVRSATG